MKGLDRHAAQEAARHDDAETWRRWCNAGAKRSKCFLVLFFKKEHLPSLILSCFRRQSEPHNTAGFGFRHGLAFAEEQDFAAFGQPVGGEFDGREASAPGIIAGQRAGGVGWRDAL